MKNTTLYSYAFVFIACVVLDRLSKIIVLNYFPTTFAITDFFSIELIFNRGISWGLLHSSSNGLFWFVSLVIILITSLVAHLAWDRLKSGHNIIGEIMVIAGSVSNIIDRFVYQGVVDFMYFSYKGWSFAIFNVADVCIVIGVGLMFLEQYKKL